MATLKPLLILGIGACALFSSCRKDYGDWTLHPQAGLSDFDQVQTDGNFTVRLSRAATASVTVEAPDELHDNYSITVEGRQLHIRWNGRNPPRGAKATVFVAAPTLSRLELNGSGMVVASDTFSTATAFIRNNGSGLMEAAFNADSVYAEVSGSGNMELKGVTDGAQYQVSGSGRLAAAPMIARRCVADVSGSGLIECYASESLRAHVSGSGLISYWGNPALVNSDVSGSGRVQKR